MINEEIDRLRHSATQALLTRKDVIICASVSCIYGLGAPDTYQETALQIKVGDDVSREKVLQRLVEMQFARISNTDVTRGTFRAQGPVLEIMPVNEEVIYRIEAPRGKVGDHSHRSVSRKQKREQKDVWIFPAKHFITLDGTRTRDHGDSRGVETAARLV